MKRKHILIAEDEPGIRRMLSLVLRGGGFDVTCVEDGTEALHAVINGGRASKSFDMLITDIRMPGLTGLELIDEMAARDIRISTLVVTGYGNKGSISELAQRGFADYIIKPFTSEQLLQSVNCLLEKSAVDQKV